MTDSSLSNDLAQILGRDDYLAAGRNRLIRFREADGSAEEARTVLGSLRGSTDGPDEARVLELLDLASGFCAAELRVWSNTIEITDGSSWQLKDPEGDLRGRVRVLGHETHRRAGPVVHVCVTELESASGTLPVDEIGHLPMAPQIFFESIRLDPDASDPEEAQSSDAAADAEGIETWRAAAEQGDGGVFGIGLADVVRLAIETVRNQGDAPE